MRSLLACLILLHPAYLLHAQRPPAATRPTVAELLSEFRRAAVPARRELVGRWVQVADVYSSGPSYIRGAFPGRDVVQADSGGIRVENGNLDWVMDVRSEGEELRLTFTIQGNWVDTVTASFNRRGEVLFGRDSGGDFSFLYRCRLGTPSRMVCIIDIDSPGHGVVFRRMP